VVVYLDSSAIVKLVVQEVESSALLALLAEHPERASSALARVEVLRAVRRARGSPSVRRRAGDVLARIALIRIDDDILARASELAPADLRSLDAIHIASALAVREELVGLVSYDERLSSAAATLKLPVMAPGRPQ
jgi:predicted nucleic acid-binding protein